MATYEIIIKNATEATSSTSPIANSNATAQDTSVGKTTKISPRRVAAAKVLGMTNGYIKPFVDQIVTSEQSLIELSTGAREQEQRMSVKTQIGQRVWNFGSSIAVGALMGGFAGAVLGGMISATSMAIELGYKQKQLDIQKSIENTSLRYMNLRAGGSVASFSGSRKTQ